ncbi:MAG: tetratricopeptide repeat protein [Planctomycetaceae bacterium]
MTIIIERYAGFSGICGPGRQGCSVTSTATIQKLHSAVRHHQSGDLPTALQLYAEILRTQPDNADAWHLSGLAAFATGELTQAESLIRHALELEPREPEFKANLASVLVNQGRSDEAEKVCRDVLRVDSKHPGALSHLGTALRQQRRFVESLDAFQTAVEQQKTCDSLCNLGAVLTEFGRFEDARQVLTEALELNPRQAQALINLAAVYRKQNDFDAAVQALAVAEQVLPDSCELFINKGNLLQEHGFVMESIEAFQTAIDLNSSAPGAIGGLGRVLQNIGQWEDSLEAHRLAVELDPTDQRYQSIYLYAVTLSPLLSPSDVAQRHLEWGQTLESTTPVLSHPNDRTIDRPLRIGYMSPDLRSHATMKFLGPLLDAHDRNAFPLYFYSDTVTEDSVTDHVRQLSTGWCKTLGLSDDEIAARIQQDQIDILVDLAGHTAGNRLPVFARKPAPVQVSFLGYPNTTGLSRIDYFLTDAIRTPPQTAAGYAEQLWLLPQAGFCYRPPESGDVAPVPCLRNGYITLGSTHRLEKISPQTLELWAAVMAAIPNARLLIFRDVFESPSLRQQTTQLLEHAGIAVDRIDFGWEMPTPYTDIYATIDILLEVTPWGAGTIACDSMWMGVPMPTVTHNIGRCGGSASLLHHCGFPELIATSNADYVDIILALANDSHLLTDLRQRLRPAMAAAVCNGPRYAEDIEAAYRQMWQTFVTAESSPGDAQC